MTFFVPFDGSALATAALAKANRFAGALDTDLIVVCVVPENRRYAQSKGWIEPGDPFDPRAIIGQLHSQALTIAPSASWESIRVDGMTTSGGIAKRLRDRAVDRDASVVVVGSKTAGKIVSSLSGVGSSVSADDKYDVFIVRKPLAPKFGTARPKSEYYQ